MPELVINDSDNDETEKCSQESNNDAHNDSKKPNRSTVQKSRDLLFEKTMYDFVLHNILFIAIKKEIMVKTKITVSLHVFA